MSFVETGIKRVRARMFLQVRLDNARAIPVYSLDTVAEHAEILEGPTQTRRRRERGVTR